MIAADMPGTIELTSIFHYNKNSRVVQEQIKGIEAMVCNGNRIKLIRLANCLSLQQLADALSANSVPISRAALSYYETGKTVPAEATINVLAKELGTIPAFFYKQDWVDFELRIFQDLNLIPSRQQELYAFIQVEMERHLEIDHALGIRSAFEIPVPQKLRADQHAQIEEFIGGIRAKWGVGINPISSVCSILESQGWYLISSTRQFGSLDIGGYEVSTRIPFLLYHPNYFVDDFRYSVLQQVGYFYLQGGDKEETELLVQRFARGILFSREQAVLEFGPKRTKISAKELSMVKQKYGISKRILMIRLHELGIIDDECYENFDTHLRQHSFLKREKAIGDTLHFYEVPTAYDIKALRAQAEGILPEETVEYFMAIQNR